MPSRLTARNASAAERDTSPDSDAGQQRALARTASSTERAAIDDTRNGSGTLQETVTAAGSAQSYPDGHGGEVRFPQGDVSFADAVEHYDTGERAPTKKSARDPEAALGIPNNAGSDSGYVSLGCAGELVLNFNDNALVDVPGPDLYLFEIGPGGRARLRATYCPGQRGAVR